jgi:iron complex outermembrane receptor protein
MIWTHGFRRRAFLASVATMAMASAAAAQPADGARTYALAAQPLGQALRAVALASGREIIAPADLVAGRMAPALSGRFTAQTAFSTLLAGSGLRLAHVGDMLVIQGPEAALPMGEGATETASSVSEVVVTGTRIRGKAPVGANIIAIDRKAIDQSGFSSTEQIVQSLPQNYGGGASEATALLSSRGGAVFNGAFGTGINLRGLGNSSTLVLLDGTRPALGGTSGTFADLSLIPSSAIERIEVLADGASALYGSDAVAGVANVIFRDHFVGGETRVRYGTADGDFGDFQVSQLFGKSWSGGHAVIAYEYSDRGNLPAADRDYATEDLRAFGGPDYRSTFASPGAILAGGQTFAIPAGQNGVGLTPSQLVPGTVNREDGRLNTDILPRQTRQTLYASASQDLDPSTTVFGQILAADRRFEIRGVPIWDSPVTVPVTNPFYVDPLGTHKSIQVDYRFADDLGPEVTSGDVRAVNATLGITRKIADWSIAAQGAYGEDREAVRLGNIVNTYWLGKALADTDPATAYNVFGGPGSTNPTTINSIRGFDSSVGLYKEWSAQLKADGPVFTLPAGAVRIAIGSEFRSDQYTNSDISYQTGASPHPSSILFPNARRIAAVFGEARIPVFGGDFRYPGLEGLDLSVAGRFERYSDVGDTTNPKVGLDWRLAPGVILKASYGTSFRAPSFQDERQGLGVVEYLPYPLTDPKSPTGITDTLFLLGNSPGIKPERAKTWTASLEVAPPQIPGLKLTATYYKVDYTGRIGAPNTDALNFLINRSVYAGQINAAPTPQAIAGYYASPFLQNPFNLPASSILVIADARTQNLSSVVQDGVDFDVGYQHPLAGGDFGVGLSGSYTLHVWQAFTAGSTPVDVVGTVGQPVSLRMRARATWSRGPFDLAGFVNYTGGYTNQTVAPAEKVAPWTTVDLNLGYRLPIQTGALSGIRVAFSVTNLFDQAPPYVNYVTPLSAIGFDSDNASAVGRFVSVEITKAW